MDVKDFYYDLPQELIAQDPLEDRSSSRLMVLDKATGEVEHRHFKDIVDYLRPVSYTHLDVYKRQSLEENASVSFMPRLTSYSVSLPRLNTPPTVSDTPQTMSATRKL